MAGPLAGGGASFATRDRLKLVSTRNRNVLAVGMVAAATAIMLRTHDFFAATMVMALAFAPACAFDDRGSLAPSGPDESTSEELEPIVIDGVLAPSVQLDGEYQIVTHFDLTEGELLPELGSEILGSLSDLRDNPSSTIVDLLTAANVPIVSTVLDLVPDLLEDMIFDVIDEVVFESLFEQVPVTERITSLIDDMASIATDFEVVSELEVGEPTPDGDTEIGHKLSGIAFRLAERRFLIQIPEVAAEATKALPFEGHAVHILEESDSVEDGRIYLADHGFGLPLGELALQGINSLLQNTIGATDLRDALGMMIDCEAMGTRIDDACLLGCSALAFAVEDMCETGLDMIALEIEGHMRDIRFDAVHFVGGEAALFDRARSDESIDGRIDRIDRGRWDLIIARDPDAAPIAAVGEFSGYRIGIDLEREEFDLIDTAQKLQAE